jgi:hypothetical protein
MLDDDPEALHCVLEFLYTGTYAGLYDYLSTEKRVAFETDAEWIEMVKRHAEVFSLADKYDIKKLKYLASEGVADTWLERVVPGEEYDHGDA